MTTTKIDWTDKVWNPTTGCSLGCDYCYAEKMAARLQRMSQEKYRHGFIPTCHEQELTKPLHWKKPARIFVNSMGDLFDPAIPFDFVDQVMATIALCSQHTFQILTKQPQRMSDYFAQDRRYKLGAAVAMVDTPADTYIDRHRGDLAVQCRKKMPWPLPNLWLGVTVTNQSEAHQRINQLALVPAAKRFVSVEPMLGPFSMPVIHGKPQWRMAVDWIICGGQTGKDAKPMHPDWVRSLCDQAAAAGVPFFFKQWGEWRQAVEAWEPRPFGIFPDGRYYQAGLLMGPINVEAVEIAKRHAGQRYERIHRVGKKKAGHLLDGQEWRQFPY